MRKVLLKSERVLLSRSRSREESERPRVGNKQLRWTFPESCIGKRRGETAEREKRERMKLLKWEFSPSTRNYTAVFFFSPSTESDEGNEGALKGCVRSSRTSSFLGRTAAWLFSEIGRALKTSPVTRYHHARARSLLTNPKNGHRFFSVVNPKTRGYSAATSIPPFVTTSKPDLRSRSIHGGPL